jgi:hypothetical protein
MTDDIDTAIAATEPETSGPVSRVVIEWRDGAMAMELENVGAAQLYVAAGTLEWHANNAYTQEMMQMQQRRAATGLVGPMGDHLGTGGKVRIGKH